MAVTKTTQFANRYGLDFKIYAYPYTQGDDALMTVDYVNEVAVDFSSNTVWATGGIYHANQIPFSDPIEGTLTLSTQIMTSELLALAAGKDLSSFSGNTVVFSNSDSPQFYVIMGKTCWKDKNGVVYTDDITAFKVAPDKAFNVTYTGEGDPNSMDITFNLMEDTTHQVFQSSVSSYTKVASPTGNPSTSGYYELKSGYYEKSTDTSVNTSKTYYTKDS